MTTKELATRLNNIMVRVEKHDVNKEDEWNKRKTLAWLQLAALAIEDFNEFVTLFSYTTFH